jgi:hypothetical protein
MAVRADSPGIEFQTDDHHTYKMKKVNRIAGNRRWDIVNDGNLKKVADIHVCDIIYALIYLRTLAMRPLLGYQRMKRRGPTAGS